MHRRHASARSLTLSFVLLSVVTAGAVAAPPAAQRGERLAEAFPGVRFDRDEAGQVRSIYGRGMTTADNPVQAAEWFIADYADEFGVAGADVRLIDNRIVGPGGQTAVVYQQYLDGLPVEQGFARVLVKHGDTSQVFFAGAKLAAAPAGGFRADAVGADEAVARVRAINEYARLQSWTAPQQVVYYGRDEIAMAEPVRAWKFSANNGDLANYRAHTFFVDSATGAVVHVRNDVYHADIIGNVRGLATPGQLPDTMTNPPTSRDLTDLIVRVQSSSDNGATDAAGDYVIPHAGTSPVSVVAALEGSWATVFPVVGTPVSLTQNTTPPGPADFLLNGSPSALTTSQVNAFVHATSTHNFYKSRQPGFTALDISIPCNVNIEQTCNAFYTTDGFNHSINFYQAGGGCVNTAFSSVIAHEYGHFIVNQHGLVQGAFGEGYSDTVAILQYNDPVVGQGFSTGGGYIRDIVAANKQYPCFDAIHDCGQVLAGVWWDLKTNFETTYGSPLGLDMARQMMTDWTEITSGGSGSDAAHPTTAIEVLSIDDDDANFSNGTPNVADICHAFEDHNIPCPANVPRLFIAYPNGRPTFVTPEQPTALRVDIDAVIDTPVPGASMIHYRVAGGAFASAALTELNPGEFEATLPGAPCAETIEYYIEVPVGLGDESIVDPPGAPFSVLYSTTAATGAATLVERNFQVDTGWIVSGDALDGQWEREDPRGDGSRCDPITDFDNSGICWLTDNNLGDTDVDGGATILESETFDLSSTDEPRVSYARWFCNDWLLNPMTDVFVVEISNDNGQNWVLLEAVGPDGPEVSGDWFLRSFRISDFVAPTAEVKLRFTASDSPAHPSVVEAAVDALKIVNFTCPAVAGPCGDFDNDGDVDTGDFAVFGQCFGGSNQAPAASCPDGVDADCDGDGDVDTGDFAIFSQNFTGSM